MIRALVTLLLAAAAGAQDLAATVPWFDPLGWTPVVVEVPARSRPLTITVMCNGQRAVLTLPADPARSRRATLLLPPGGETWGSPGVNVSSDDPVLNSTVGEPDRPESPFVVVGAPAGWTDQTAEALAKRLDTTPGLGRGGSGTAHARTNRIPAEAFPDRWEALPAWLTIVLAREAEAALDGGQRTALRRWLAAGGQLVVEDDAQAAGWREALRPPITIGRQPERPDANGLEYHRAPESLGRQLGSERAGGWLFAVFAGVVALVAGPLPLLIARKRGRPALLLVLIPALGFGATVLLLIIDLALVGWGVRRVVWDLTLVDPVAGEQVQWTGLAGFAGRAPQAEAGAIRWSLPEGEEPRWTWTGGADERIDGALWPARTEALRGCVRRHADRRRLVVRPGPGGPVAVNALGTGVRMLHWRDAKGGWWTAEQIPDGGEVAMREGWAAPKELPPAAMLPAGADPAVRAVLRRPGGWVARLDAPLHGPPGPAAEDHRPPEGWAIGVAP